MYCYVVSCLRFLLPACLVLFGAGGAGGQVVDFEDLSPTIEYSGPGGGFYENGANLTPVSTSPGPWGGEVNHNVFTSGGITFKNDYYSLFDSWSGWSYSNTTDTATAGFTNQFSAYTGGGVNNSENYGVYYGDFDPPPTVAGIPAGTLLGAYFTNTTYAALSMLNGDDHAKQFEDGDWFKLMITGLDAGDQETGAVVFDLADYTSSDPDDWYIVDQWTWVDLTSLGVATQLQFEMSSSDVGDYGMNTPAYFAMDNLTMIPEPTSLLLLLCGAVVGMAGLGRRCRRQAM